MLDSSVTQFGRVRAKATWVKVRRNGNVGINSTALSTHLRNWLRYLLVVETPNFLYAEVESEFACLPVV